MTDRELIRGRLKTYFRMLAVHDPRLGNELVDVLDVYLDAKFKREWQTLTENEIKHLWYEACQTNLELTSQLIVHLAKNIEAKLREKNSA